MWIMNDAKTTIHPQPPSGGGGGLSAPYLDGSAACVPLLFFALLTPPWDIIWPDNFWHYLLSTLLRHFIRQLLLDMIDKRFLFEYMNMFSSKKRLMDNYIVVKIWCSKLHTTFINICRKFRKILYFIVFI